MIKQFIPQEFCLKCKQCCRFSEEDSVWLPCLLDEEIQELLDKEALPAVSISIKKRIHPRVNPEGGFVCPLLGLQDNKCRIYDARPFECQLYPFLITLRDKLVILTVDLNCPYIRENLKSEEVKAYVEYLNTFLNSARQKRALKDNPQLIQAYEEALDTSELNF